MSMMKKILFLLSLFVATWPQAVARQSVRQQLLSRLQQLQVRGYMFGHQDDPFYGVHWQWEKGRSDVKEVSGD